MDCSKTETIKKSLAKKEVYDVLDRSLKEEDFFCNVSQNLLKNMGFKREEALILLACNKSLSKYGYTLSPTTLSHLLHLAEERKNGSSLTRLVESPFFLMKAGWLYEQAPFFNFFKGRISNVNDRYINQFAHLYETLFLENRVTTETWESLKNPKQVITSTFWENKIFDPVAIIDKIRQEGLKGLELSIDFHPFNFTKLLPEELDKKKREEIKDACRKSGLRLDIHSPIVGPYSQSSDIGKGKPLFFDPLKRYDLQRETIQLAKDIGAGSVVFHLIDTSDIKKWVDLITEAADSPVRVTLENYYCLKYLQSSAFFISIIDAIHSALPQEIRKRNFGITLDVGHLNIENEDPLLGSEKIGKWCLEKGVFLRLHATDNYGKLLFHPPAYSADIHSNVSGRGINNAAIIILLRSLGHQFDVIAEQIQPLTQKDVTLVNDAQSFSVNQSYEVLVQKGRDVLSSVKTGALITQKVIKTEPYLFLAGLKGIRILQEHLIFRKIQDKKYLTVDEAKKISTVYMKMPQKFRIDLIEYMDTLLLSVQNDTGVLQKSKLDLICQNISGALFATLNNEHLNQIFSESKLYYKGDCICKQNTRGHEMYFIKEGTVEVFLNDTPITTLGPGDIFGEISLFYNVKRTATIKAAQDKTVVGILTRNRLENLLTRSDPYSHALILRLYTILPERLRNLNDKYRTAINSLYCILGRDQDAIPPIDHIQQKDITLTTNLIPQLSTKETQHIFKDIKHFTANQIIFNEGDKGDGMYIILEGRVKVVTNSSGKKEILLRELDTGDIFGEMAIIDAKTRSAKVIAITPCKAAFISKKAFNTLIKEMSDLSFRLMGLICLSLFERILRLDKIYGDVKKAFD